MSETVPDFEALLSRALAPVEPPEDLAERLETTLVELTEAAADELEAWELGAMHDPRNWIRPAAAIVVGASAGTALVLVRARRRAKSRSRTPNVFDAAEKALRDFAAEARKLGR